MNMKENYFKESFIFLMIALVLSSCVVTQKYISPGMPVPANVYRDTIGKTQTINNGTSSAEDIISIANLPYTQIFSDTVLQSLITEGIRENLNLKTAIERINEASASFRQSKAAFFPELDAGANVTRTKQSFASSNLPSTSPNTFPLTAWLYQLSLSASWDADIWGKLKSSKRAAFANLLGTDAAKRAIQTQLVSNIATYYYQLLSLDQQLKITEQTLANRTDEIETLKALKEAAVVTGAAVVQSEANRYAAEVLIPDLKQNIRETENALSILLARAPGNIRRTTLMEQVSFRDLKTGVSTLLLKNRPDVQQAEFGFRTAFENTNVARTYFYPQLTITANGGTESLQLKDLFTASVFYNIVAGLTQPVFSKGLNKARLRIAIAQQKEAYYNYQQSLLNAGQEVSNALYAFQTALEKQTSRTHEIDALEKAVDYTKQLLEYSSATNYTDVLTSEQSLLSAQLNGVNDKLQQLQAIVDLYHALGGGW
ncbi:MAG: efflux transporter outer membrane subunit [Bacteroidota bacterium]|nr:efflux transporter outer membrane subunit [Bacteroidota bacterium]